MFMLSKEQCNEILAVALQHGAQFAEIYAEETLKDLINLVNEKVDKVLGGIDSGVGIRVISDHKVIYSYTNDFTIDNLKALAKKSAIALKTKSNNTVMPFMNEEILDKHKPKIIATPSLKKDAIEKIRLGNKASKKHSKHIAETAGSYKTEIKHLLIANSEGLYKTDVRNYTRVTLSAIASNGNDKQVGSVGPGKLGGFELFDEIDTVHLGEKTAESATTMLHAGYMEPGKFPVVIENGFGGVIFHEACGHPIEAQFVAKGASVFTDKLGKQIGNEKLNVVDDGTLPNEWGSSNFDDEGTKTQRNQLIENGILKSYLVDRLSGEKLGLELTGSGRRQNYKFPPTSRMNNTFILNGNDDKQKMIESIEFGLYAKEMGGGSVQYTSDFNFSVREGYVIRNGKIAEPVRGATLIGKGKDILWDIDMVSDNLAQAQGVCGSSSGQIPTNVGQPAIRVREITVGGR